MPSSRGSGFVHPSAHRPPLRSVPNDTSSPLIWSSLTKTTLRTFSATYLGSLVRPKQVSPPFIISLPPPSLLTRSTAKTALRTYLLEREVPVNLPSPSTPYDHRHSASLTIPKLPSTDLSSSVSSISSVSSVSSTSTVSTVGLC